MINDALSAPLNRQRPKISDTCMLAACVPAVLISTSARWFNYRHVANAFAFWNLLSANGIPASDIFLVRMCPWQGSIWRALQLTLRG